MHELHLYGYAARETSIRQQENRKLEKKEKENLRAYFFRFLLDADISGDEGGPPLLISTLLTLGGEAGAEEGPRLSAPRSAEVRSA